MEQQNSNLIIQEKKPDFKVFVSSLILQAMIFLGKIENPLTKKYEPNLNQAKFMLQTLKMLKEKTKNNLSSEEEELLNVSLKDLECLYNEEIKK